MRKYFTILAALAALVSVPGYVSADSVVLSNLISKATLAQSCEKAGGTPTSGNGPGGYGCKKENCDGKGGTCTVKCERYGVCTGTTPALVAVGERKLRGNVAQVLGNAVAEKRAVGLGKPVGNAAPAASEQQAKKKGTGKPQQTLQIKMQDANISTHRRSQQPSKENIGTTASSPVRR
jgi:hypothetical protein